MVFFTVLTSAAESDKVSVVALTYVTGTALPAIIAVVVGRKFVPVTVMVCGTFNRAAVGQIPTTVGAAFAATSAACWRYGSELFAAAPAIAGKYPIKTDNNKVTTRPEMFILQGSETNGIGGALRLCRCARIC